MGLENEGLAKIHVLNDQVFIGLYMKSVMISKGKISVYWESFTEENICEFCGFWNDHNCFLAAIFYF